jgi:DNA-binding response OmpR family regulator/anti-sigma regulatory factor (Ser/Thr protein kinase)
VSHEFRTPLTLIINPINKLLQKKDNNNENPELNVVYRNARRLLSLTNQLLLFRKADSGADDLKITKTVLNTLVDEVFVCFTQEAAIRNIQYHLSATQKYIEIYADVEKLEIAVFNLVSNAFKFTPDGGSISINIVDKADTAEVLVSDTGSGIVAETGHAIFDKFRQANNKKQKSGFGIGLYLVKTFIEKHGGKINYESELGKGTTFTIELLKGNAHFGASVNFVGAVEKPDILKELAEEPLLPSTPTEVEIEQKQQEKVVSVSEKKSVLVVEDNLDIRNYLKKILGENYTVYEASNGHEGLKQTQKKQPDIIISDINMDGMDGMELCKKIKADEGLSHIPIVLLTGSYSSEMKLQGIENGADDYITKPFETDLLLARVNNILKRQNNLRRYFFDSITLRENTVKVPAEYQDFLNRCIEIVEANLDNDEFSIKTFCKEIGMSHSNLYVKVKQISGQTVNSFIRSIRLRRAAVLMLKEDTKIAQIAFQVGIGDIKYFREQFNKLFGMNPSDYVKKYKGSFNKDYNVVKAEE